MRRFSKHIATVVISDPVAVQARCSATGWEYHDGSIFCSIPEIGMTGTNLVYCRYGLGIPYIRVQIGWRLLVEPTIEDQERWFFTGFVDCGGQVVPDTTTQLFIQLLSQVIYATTVGTMHLSSDSANEAFVLGTTALIELQKHQAMIEELKSAISGWSPVAEDGGAALKAALSTFLSLPTPDYSSILSTKIFGE